MWLIITTNFLYLRLLNLTYHVLRRINICLLTQYFIRIRLNITHWDDAILTNRTWSLGIICLALTLSISLASSNGNKGLGLAQWCLLYCGPGCSGWYGTTIDAIDDLNCNAFLTFIEHFPCVLFIFAYWLNFGNLWYHFWIF